MAASSDNPHSPLPACFPVTACNLYMCRFRARPANLYHICILPLCSVLMRNFEFELLDPLPEPDYNAMVIGPKPCRVRYIRRKLVV